MKDRIKTDIHIVPMATSEEMDGKGYAHWKSWHETYTGLVDPAYMKRMTLEKCVDLAHRWAQNQMVAKDGDRVIGFNGYDAETGEVVALYVLREYQGKKIGLALMNAAMEKLADHDTISLWVLEGNEKAIRFYEKYGFHFDGTTKKIKLGEPRTALRMVFDKALQNIEQAR